MKLVACLSVDTLANVCEVAVQLSSGFTVDCASPVVAVSVSLFK